VYLYCMRAKELIEHYSLAAEPTVEPTTAPKPTPYAPTRPASPPATPSRPTPRRHGNPFIRPGVTPEVHPAPAKARSAKSLINGK
jgi:hypothetical protein